VCKDVLKPTSARETAHQTDLETVNPCETDATIITPMASAPREHIDAILKDPRQNIRPVETLPDISLVEKRAKRSRRSTPSRIHIASHRMYDPVCHPPMWRKAWHRAIEGESGPRERIFSAGDSHLSPRKTASCRRQLRRHAEPSRIGLFGYKGGLHGRETGQAGTFQIAEGGTYSSTKSANLAVPEDRLLRVLQEKTYEPRAVKSERAEVRIQCRHESRSSEMERQGTIREDL
jgi:hypothetical protein